MTDTVQAPETTAARRRLAERMSLPPGRREGLFPPNAAQRAMWIAQQLRPDASMYHMPALLRLTGALDVAELGDAIQRVVDRHEALRASVRAVEGSPLLHIRARREHPLTVVDAAGRLEADVVAEANERAHEPFDLAAGPLLRTVLWRLAEHEHLLLVAVHHLVADGWSLGVLLEDLAEAFAHRGEPVDAAPGLQFADLGLREPSPAAAKAGAEAWAARMAGATALDLPEPDEPPAAPSCITLRLPLPPGLPDRLRAAARASGATEYAFCFAALAAVLGRLTGRRDLTLGATIALRGPATEHTAGLLINTLPIRLDLGAPTAFSGLVAEAAAGIRFAAANAAVPLERIVRDAAPARPGARAPFLDAVFSLIPDRFTSWRLGGAAAERLPVAARAAKFPLLVSLEAAAAGTVLVAELDPALVDPDFADSLLKALRCALAAAAADPGTPLEDLPLLDEEELAAALARATGPAAADLLGGRGFAEVVAAHAARRPDRTALVEGDRRISYRALNDAADVLAARLQDAGIGRGDPVAVVLPRGADQITACLAVLRAGGHYAPLDPDQPRERNRFMLIQAGVRLLISEGEDYGLPDARALDPRGTARGASAPPLADAPSSPDEQLLIGFTSGSTGRPKGYTITQSALARLLGDPRHLPAPAGAERVFLIANAVTFDASTWETWATLLTGSTGVIAPEYSYSAGALGRLIRAHGVTTLHLTTQLFNAIVDEDPYALLPLRELVVGGEALSPEQVRRTRRTLPGLRLLNAYGPAECAVMATVAELAAPGPTARRVPIGPPVADTRVYVLDDRRRLLPPGAVGEIHLGGPRIGLGYAGRGALTAERFVPSPFAAGERLYRTGDLGKVRTDGTLVHLGRADRQLKIRGYRVEPGEIESCLIRHPSVAAAAVAVSGAGRLAAYIVPSGLAPSVTVLHTHLRAELPGYMVPADIVVLDRLPLSANGKLDRAALPEPVAGPALAAPIAPRDDLERAIAEVWAEVLGLPAGGLSVREDFFDAGGHSLLAARAASRLELRLGRPVPLRLFFDQPTVAGLARALTDAAPAGPEPEPAASPAGGPAPLSFAQQRLWFLHQMDPGSALYNLPLAVRLTGRPDVAALGRALRVVSDRHEPLRTVFATDPAEGGAYQRVLEPCDVPLVLIATQGTADERRAAADRAAQDAALAPFDLSGEPPLRAHLITAGPDEHILLLTVHHIVCDGWSAQLLAREISLAYAAALTEAAGEPGAAAGAVPGLADLPIRYGDYAIWQRARMTGSRRAEELAHWERALDGAPRVLELPADHPRPPVLSYRGGTEPLHLDARLTEGLHAAAAENRVTPFMVLVAGLAVVLHRYTGRDDLLIGTPVAGRAHTAVENLIGFFANTLVLRIDLSGDPSAWELMQRVHGACVEAFEHQELPFEQLVEHLRPERDLSRTPLFQVMLAAQGEPLAEVRLPGLDATPYPVANPSARCDLTVLLREGRDGIGGGLEYNADLFAPQTAARMAGHLTRALAWLAFGDGNRLSEAELSGPLEHAELVRLGTGPAGAGGASPLPAILAQAARRPAEAAVLDGDGAQRTYAELVDEARAIAARLRAAGVRRGDLVAVQLPRTAGIAGALLGVWLAGAAFVPFDPEYPRERLAFMATDCGATAVLTDRAHRGGGFGAREVLVDEPPADPEPTPTSDPDFNGSEPAYVLYTSGSTGRPKGVVVTHAALANLLADMAREPGLTEDDRLVSVTSYSFDMGMLELFGPPAAGARVVIATAEQTKDPDLLGALVRRARATVVQATPATWRLLAPAASGFDPPLRAWAGGEALPAELAADLLAAGHELWNGYGPTETTVYSAVARIEDPAEITIGRPVAGTRLLLLDERSREVPAGAVGEICVGGLGLAQGYLARPGLTAERFVPSPEGDGRRLYRTGDLGRWDHRGRLVYLGRADRQIKIRGLRVEPGEVEACLSRCPGVLECVVVARGEQLTAYLVLDAASAPAGPDGAVLDGERAATLRRALKRDLPDYLVPSVLVRLRALPLTANGKVDRDALPEPRHAAQGTAARVAPRSETERLVLAVWAAVLERPEPGLSVHDDFFDAGGHSLLATAVCARLTEALGRRVPVRLVFERPTAAGLAEALDAAPARSAADAGPAPRRERAAGRDRFPLSFAQERLWFLHRMDPGAALYNVPLALRLTGPLRVDLLDRALLTVVEEHETLRTVYGEHEGRAYQRILAPAAELAVVELDTASTASTAITGSAAEELLARVLRHAGYAPFDLTSPIPPLRATLIRLAPEDHVLSLTVHHIACDGWSIGLLARRLSVVYTDLAIGREPEAAAAPIQYADYALWQRDRLAGHALDAELAHWAEVLSGAPASLELPTDHPRPAVFAYRGAGIPLVLDAETTAGLRTVAAEHRLTPFMVLAAALTAVLGRFAGQDDILIGAPQAGRVHPGLEPLIGLFANTLVLRIGLHGDPSVAELLDRAKAACLDAYEHADVPFERLVEHLAPPRDLSRTPLFQVMLALQHDPIPELGLPGVTAAPHRVENPTAKYDLVFTLREDGETVGGVLEYNRDLLEPASARAIRDALLAALRALPAAGPGGRVAELPMNTAEEGARLLSGWNREPGYDPETCLHELVDRQIAASPDAVAVLCDARDRTLTYRELDERADRLARALLEAGAGTDDLVAVLLPRSPELVVTLLAVLRAGAGFLPLDPEHPAERIGRVLEDSGVRIAVSAQPHSALLGGRVATVLGPDGAALGPAALHPTALHPAPPRRGRATPASTAYAIYTSGSTGRPKGVLVPHRAIVNNLLWMQQDWPLDGHDRLLQKTTIAFDVAVKEVFWPLLCGAAVVLARPGGQRDPEYLIDLIERHGVTVAHFVPSMLEAALAYTERTGRAFGPRLEKVMSGAETLPAATLRRFFAASTAELLHMYGPTETAIAVTGWTCPRGHVPERIPLGTPMPAVRLYVLDTRDRPVPRGAWGELHVGGTSLGRGYLHRPAETAAAFVPDPYSGEAGARLYRTGDIVRINAAGLLEFRGRADNQIKVRGFRIELGDIEAALSRHPDVRQCAVVGRRAPDGSTATLVGYAGTPHVGLTGQDLREYLRTSLPDYMVPAVISVLPSLPVNSNGKIDRDALPVPTRTVATARSDASASPLERTVAAAFAEVLGLPAVGVDEDLFALGGHSLLVPRLAALVAERTGVEVPLREIFLDPTAAGVARAVRRPVEGAAAPAPALVRVDRAARRVEGGGR